MRVSNYNPDVIMNKFDKASLITLTFWIIPFVVKGKCLEKDLFSYMCFSETADDSTLKFAKTIAHEYFGSGSPCYDLNGQIPGSTTDLGRFDMSELRKLCEITNDMVQFL